MDGKGDASVWAQAPPVKPSRTDFRAMILYDYLQGKKYAESFETLSKCFGDTAPSIKTVYNWFKEFGFGRRSLEDSDRCGQPKSVTIEENVTRVKELIEENPRITVEEMMDTLNLTTGSMDRILHSHLNVRKRCAHWVPHRLTEEHTAAATLDYLQENGVQLVTHPPYSSDLAPCDFFLFPTIKKELKGKPFETVEDARAFVENQISCTGNSEWAGAVDSWFRRMDKCIHANGEYFEHLS